MHDYPEIESQSEFASAKCQIHAVLLRVFDAGVLLLGESGVGKSECALELLAKGHRLVADDAVEVFVEADKLRGRAPAVIRDLLAIHGLGIINIRKIFGEHALCFESEIDLCIELQECLEAERNENTITDYDIAGQIIPRFVLPAGAAGNRATLVETAVRLQLNGGAEGTSARLFVEQQRERIDSIQ